MKKMLVMLAMLGVALSVTSCHTMRRGGERGGKDAKQFDGAMQEKGK
jgi:hypothetical protein